VPVTPRGERIVLGALLLLFVSRAVIAERVVPPWQGPDEPTHFVLSYVLTQPPEVHRRTIETQVLEAMDRHRWWELYGREKKYPVPWFDGVEGLGSGTLEHPLYYGIAAATLTVTRPATLDSAYRHLRGLGIVLSALTLLLGWAGARHLLGAEAALAATALAALNPQFALAAITVNADALLNVLGALLWWQTARILSADRRAFPLILLLLTGIAAALTKRLGAVLLIVAAVVVVQSFFTTQRWRLSRRSVLLTLSAAALAVVTLLAAWILFESQFEQFIITWRDAVTVRRPLQETTAADAFATAGWMIDYWWLVAGWLRFPAPEAWMWIARAITVVGVAGAAAALLDTSGRAQRLWVPWLFLLSHVAAVLAVTLWTVQSAPQGRYLFPVIVPTCVLIYAGTARLVPAKVQQYWPVCLIALVAAMDVSGLALVLVPVYAP